MSVPDSHFEQVNPRGNEVEEDNPRAGHSSDRAVPSTKTSASWSFVAVALVLLVIVLVFILENLHATDATFFGIHWRIPLGLDLLLAALLGATAVFLVGAARTLQLRLLARRRRRAQTTATNTSSRNQHKTEHASSEKGERS